MTTTTNRTDRKPSCPDCGREATISTTSEGTLYCYECGASVHVSDYQCPCGKKIPTPYTHCCEAHADIDADVANKLSELRADVAYLKAMGTQGTYGLTRSQIGSRIRGKLALIHRLAEES